MIVPVKSVNRLDLSRFAQNMSYNFWIMDFAVSALIFISAKYGEQARRKSTQPSNNSTENSTTSLKLIVNDEKGKETSLLTYLALNFAYFSAMGLLVTVLQYQPYAMIVLQHFAVMLFILVVFSHWFTRSFGYPAGVVFCLIWVTSVQTSYRWLINNIIIGMFALLASHVHFRNFAFLQIFLWTAFLYDIFLLSRMNKSPQLFSVSIFDCSSLLCKLFEMNNTWELPAVFTVRFGHSATHVFLGTGDIIIGSIISNFSMSFFKSSKCVVTIVASYWLAIGLLSKVDSNRPYPALVSIVPCCTLALVVCAILCRKTKSLFSLNQCNEQENSELHSIETILVL